MRISSERYKSVQLGIFTLLRGAALWLALMITILLFVNGIRVVENAKQYSGYRDLAGYYGVRISPNIDVSEEGIQRLDDALVAFYRATNGENSRLFSVGSQVMLYNDGFISREELDFKEYVVTVNMTYLKEKPVYGTDGSVVRITGNSEEDYLLVPEKYRDREAELKQYYQENNTFLRYYVDDAKAYGIKAAHEQKHTLIPLNIIYVSDGQRHRMNNLADSGKLQGVIEDPIIKVVTTENVSPAQIPHYVTNQDYLVRISDAEQRQVFEQVLKDTGLAGFIMQVYSVKDEAGKNLKLNAGALLIQAVLLIFIQMGITILQKKLFKNMDQRLIVRNIIISWIIMFALLMFTRQKGSIVLFLSVFAVMLFEIFRVYTFCGKVSRIERRISNEKNN